MNKRIAFGGRIAHWLPACPATLLRQARTTDALRSACALIIFACFIQPANCSWRATGPFGGDAELVRVIPQTPGMVVAGSRNGLLFLSVNGGASWSNIAFPAQFAGVLHALEVDPHSAGVWYAGTESQNPWYSGIF